MSPARLARAERGARGRGARLALSLPQSQLLGPTVCVHTLAITRLAAAEALAKLDASSVMSFCLIVKSNT